MCRLHGLILVFGARPLDGLCDFDPKGLFFGCWVAAVRFSGGEFAVFLHQGIDCASALGISAINRPWLAILPAISSARAPAPQ